MLTKRPLALSLVLYLAVAAYLAYKRVSKSSEVGERSARRLR